MTECANTCGRPADGYYLCRWCADDLSHQLRGVGALVAELDTARTRQARMGNGVIVSTSGPQPLPFDAGASEAFDVLRNTLSTWARDLAGRIGHELDTDTLTGCARWLRARLHSIRIHPAAGELADEITHALRHAWAAIDRPRGKVYVGPCRAELASGVCEAEVYARADPGEPGRPDPAQSTVACPECGTGWDATERRAWLLDELRDTYATAREIASAAGAIAGKSINAKTIRTWANRGLIGTQTNPNGPPRHLIGDVIDRATRQAGQ